MTADCQVQTDRCLEVGEIENASLSNRTLPVRCFSRILPPSTFAGGSSDTCRLCVAVPRRQETWIATVPPSIWAGLGTLWTLEERRFHVCLLQIDFAQISPAFFRRDLKVRLYGLELADEDCSWSVFQTWQEVQAVYNIPSPPSQSDPEGQLILERLDRLYPQNKECSSVQAPALDKVKKGKTQVGSRRLLYCYRRRQRRL